TRRIRPSGPASERLERPAETIFLIDKKTHAQSNKFTISGYIKEEGSGETLPGVGIYCDSLKQGVSSNHYGFYSISLPQGSHKLIVSFIGYGKKEISIKLNNHLRTDINLAPGVQLNEVVVNAEEQKKVSDEARMSVISIPVQQIKDIPALLGEKDVLKVIQLLPGVQKGSEGSSGLYVRGGGPDQNLIILDDATVYNAYHLFGFFSLFNGDALKSVELVKGGFPSRYGGRLSSVLDMQMKEGNMQKIKGEAGVGILSSRFMLEGPILKNKVSFLVSARRTYADALVYPFLPKNQKAGYYFYDLNAKINWIVNDKNRVFLSGYFGKDKFYFNSSESLAKTSGNMQWGNGTGTIRWNHIYTPKLFSNTSLILSDYKLQLGIRDEFDTTFFDLRFKSGIRDWTAKHDFDFFPNNYHHLKFGVQTTQHKFTPSAVVLKANQIGAETKVNNIYSIESGIYIEDDWKITSLLRINYGIRASFYTVKKTNFIFPEPRFSARYLLNETSALKISYAMMNQYIHLLSSTGVSLPTDLWVPATNGLKPMQSQQFAIGYAKDIKEDFTLEVEGYYKSMKRVSFYKEGASFLLADDPTGAQDISWEKNITQGKGWSYGGEILFKKNKGKWTGWIGYTLSWIYVQFDSINFGNKFHPRYDRRHDVSFVNIYKLNNNITFSLTWVYGTGNAITLPLAQYNAAPHNPLLQDGYSEQKFFGNNTNFRNDYGEKNSFRMAAYHRMDIGVQFHKTRKYFTRTFEISVYNLYSRMNPFFYYIEQTNDPEKQKLKQITLFPIIPSVSWSFKF
ncbi:MAG: TonB-dependent receptor, partial [Bacteroidota bacterium]